MKKRKNPFYGLFVLFMAVFCVLLIAFTVLNESLSFQNDETALSLKTSMGREAKQNYEYRQVRLKLPASRMLLASMEPLSRMEIQKADELTQKRNMLRRKKKELTENMTVTSEPKEDHSHD